jgi:lysyl-tRNA synthetase class 2
MDEATPGHARISSRNGGMATLAAPLGKPLTQWMRDGHRRAPMPRPRNAVSPVLVARLVALVGVVSVVSALVPAWRSRLALLAGIVPPVAPAAADAGAAAVGVLLVLLARGLRRGGRRAWWTAVGLVGAVIVLHLVKGLDVEEASLSTGVLVLLLLSRRQFVAASPPRSLRTTLAVAVSAVAFAIVLGFLLLSMGAGVQSPTVTWAQRMVHATVGLVGVPGPVIFRTPEAQEDASVSLVVLGATCLLTVLIVALRPPGGAHPLTPEEEDRLRDLLDRQDAPDSLSYFALRRDRAVVFSPSGKAAVSYRLVGGVSLAAGDPIGDPEAWPGAIRAWLGEARGYGWTPAVLAASERAAGGYAREGLDALELGDEAIVDPTTFTTEGRSMRGVRQAVARTGRAGYRIRIDRVAELPPEELQSVRDAVASWRDGPVERGYSMALGRLGDPADGACVLVRASDRAGVLRGSLHFVPWGRHGLSLDVMRRARDAENGTVELMVTGLLGEAARLGVLRVSLNFAVFRAVFARGERLGAGPVLRLWRALLLQVSRFWQIESLYRANAKYDPEWVPRFLCFARAGDLPAVSVAALRAEAFLVRPSWLRRPGRSPGRGRPVELVSPAPEDPHPTGRDDSGSESAVGQGRTRRRPDPQSWTRASRRRQTAHE